MRRPGSSADSPSAPGWPPTPPPRPDWLPWPWWDDAAVGLISGLSFGTRLPQIARAALESIAFQVEDVVAALDRATGEVQTLLADGGATANRTLMQLQADTSGRRVERALARD